MNSDVLIRNIVGHFNIRTLLVANFIIECLNRLETKTRKKFIRQIRSHKIEQEIEFINWVLRRFSAQPEQVKDYIIKNKPENYKSGKMRPLHDFMTIVEIIAILDILSPASNSVEAKFEKIEFPKLEPKE